MRLGQQLLDTRAADRAAEQKTLPIVAAKALKLVELLDGFDTFGHSFHAQIVGHGDDGAHKILVIAIQPDAFRQLKPERG